jgi:hypothetical protein
MLWKCGMDLSLSLFLFLSLSLPSLPSAVTEAGKTGDPYAKTFFRKEYTLNHLIGTILLHVHVQYANLLAIA